jgi:flagellar motor switch protein FliN
VAAPYVLVLASALLGRACDDMGEAEGEAIRNLCQATIEGLCVADAAKLGAVESVSKISSDVLPSEHVSRLTLANPDGSEVGFEVRLTQELVLSLSRKEPEPPAIDTEEAMPEAFAEQEADVATPVTHHLPFELNGRTFRDPVESANLDLVLDVELNVTLRFGQRQLSLREVLELTSGSVVELDRQVEEPVELLLDGKVIARGEAVVIDGNYGMRITEVPQQFIPTALR